MSYTALYRKYRPARFEDVLGQEHIVRTLKNQLAGGKVSHAYLFCGTRGTGKTSLAKIFAKAINCLNSKDGEPCGKCKICVEIENERSLNIIEIDAASNNGVENIREIREEVRYTPAEGKYKVYIIDEVHMLSASAYNAFLKTLEEPPAHVIFILATTDPQKIPATIHSRCQRYDFKRIPQRLIAERLADCAGLEGVNAETDALGYIAGLSDGSMRDALSLLDRCVSFFEGETVTLAKVLEITGSIDTKSFFELTEHLNNMDVSGALSVVDTIVSGGKDVNQVVFEALAHFRSIIIAKSVDNPAQILDISEEHAGKLAAQSEKMDSARIMAYINAFSELQASAKTPYALNARVLLEITLIKLCNPEIINNSYEEIHGKLAELEKKLESGVVPAVNVAKASNAEAVQHEPEQALPVKKVLLPGSFSEAKERYREITESLLAERESSMLGAILERTEPGFLDDKHLYIIFNDETNENILKDSPKKLEALEKAFERVTGKAYSIKTITRKRFERESKSVDIVEEDKEQGAEFLESVKGVFEEFQEE